MNVEGYSSVAKLLRPVASAPETASTVPGMTTSDPANPARRTQDIVHGMWRTGQSNETLIEAVSSGSAEWRREASTMSFYVAICLLAAMAAVGDAPPVPTMGIVWGTTVGLTLAHLFAFSLAAGLVGRGKIDQEVAVLATAQLCGAAVVAVLASVPVLVLSPPIDLDVARLVVAGFIGIAAFAVARLNGAGGVRALLFSTGGMVVAVLIAVVKNVLLGH